MLLMSTCPVTLVAMKFYRPKRQLGHFLFVLRHDSLVRTSGRVDFFVPWSEHNLKGKENSNSHPFPADTLIQY